MLNHKFTSREAAVILILVAVILGYFYYYVVYQSFETELAKYDTMDVEDEIAIEEAKAIRLAKMKEELEAGEASTSILGVYNNQSEELSVLAGILEGNAIDISMNWSDPELNGTVVRRDVTISFTTGNFDEAGDLIKQIADCEYALLIVDMSMDESEIEEEIEVAATGTMLSDGLDAVVEGEEGTDTVVAEEPQTETITVTTKVTTVNMTIRFFETTNGAANLNGLAQPTPEVTPAVDDDGLPSTEELNEQINGD